MNRPPHKLMSPEIHSRQVAGTHWDPNQYLKFSDHRLRPALELLARVPLESPKIIYDLGCGAGNVTRVISERWPSATVYGVDHSQEMLSQAASTPSRVQWIEADILKWGPNEPADLLYANPTLQWLEAHQDLFPRLVGCLNPGDYLAIQMPLSWNLRSHRLMRETLMNGGPDGKSLGTDQLRESVARDWVESAEFYHDLLVGSTRSLDIWETEYLQLLEGQDAVLDWVKGTGLRPILVVSVTKSERLSLRPTPRAFAQPIPSRPMVERFTLSGASSLSVWSEKLPISCCQRFPSLSWHVSMYRQKVNCQIHLAFFSRPSNGLD